MKVKTENKFQDRAQDTALEHPLFLSTAPAGPRDRQIGLMVVWFSFLSFLISMPFAKVPLTPLLGFIPIYQSALVICDLITAVLLLGQFSILRTRALLLLAGAYLFTACMATAHTLTFPGLFSQAGLFGAGPQTTAWLYMFWHGGFPLLVIAYAYMKAHQRCPDASNISDRIIVLMVIAAVLAATCGLTLLATVGQDALPVIMHGHQYTSTMFVVVASVWGLSILALAVVWQSRSRTVLDLWLMVVLCAWSLDIALSAVFNGGRFDLGFYGGRIYGLLAASFVLIMMLLENNRLYGLLIETHRNDRIKAAELRRLSTLDPLTRLANRRAFDEALDEEWRRSMRHRTSLCLLMIDVDCFKRFNDRYGHVAGDQCLRGIAQVLVDNARRAGEVAARYGGEEFAVLLPQVDEDDAFCLGQQICQGVRDLDIPHEASTVGHQVTISVGLASTLECASESANSFRNGQDAAGPTTLVEMADRALYAAKTNGRNRVARLQSVNSTTGAEERQIF
jgi:diguanylate cyclase (GGDEF)-like protein